MSLQTSKLHLQKKGNSVGLLCEKLFSERLISQIESSFIISIFRDSDRMKTTNGHCSNPSFLLNQ